MGLSRGLAGWVLLVAGLTSPGFIFAQSLVCGMPRLPDNLGGSFSDQGLAFQACRNSIGSSSTFWISTGDPFGRRLSNIQCELVTPSGTPSPTGNQYMIRADSSPATDNFNCNFSGATTRGNWSAGFTFSASCATRPVTSFAWTNAQHDGVCSQGCEYDFQLPSCSWTGPEGNRVYSCTSTAIPSGNVCTGTDFRGTTAPPPDSGNPPPPPPPPPDPEDPPPPPPDPEDPPPPPPPDPEDPPPPPPPDPEDPPPPPPPGGGGSDVNLAGVESRLDAIAQAIASADQAARTDAQQTRGAINGARDAIVSAINGVRSELDGIGDSVDGVRDAVEDLGDDLATWDGPADDGEAPDPWGEATPVDLSALNDSGFGWSRSCPAFPSVTVMGHSFSPDPNGNACSLLSIFAALILLAGYVQAGFIIASRGNA